jgi:hypothetical protein
MAESWILPIPPPPKHSAGTNLPTKPKIMRRLKNWIIEFTCFFGECIHWALFNNKWISVVSTVSLPAGMLAVLLIYIHPEWSNANQALANAIFILMIPISAALLFGFVRLIFSPFCVYKNLSTRHAREVDAITRDRDRLKGQLEFYTNNAAQKKQSQLDGMLNHISQKLKDRGINKLTPFHAIFLECAGHNMTNEDIIWLSDQTEKIGYRHPFRGLEELVRQDEWQEFLLWGHRHHTLKFDRGIDYLDGALEFGAQHGRAKPAKDSDFDMMRPIIEA